MKTLRRALDRCAVLASLGWCAALSACAADSDAPTAATSDAGAVRAALTFPGGDSISTMQWVITGPNGASTVVQQGVVDLQDASTLTLMIGGLPPAPSYVITLTGTSDAGSTCVGAGQFSVAARTTTSVSVSLSCATATADSGVVTVMGKARSCPSVMGVWAMPFEVTVGHAIALTAAASAFDGGATRFHWSAPSGSFSSPDESATLFTCATPGTIPVTVAVSDAPDGGICNGEFSTSTVLVTCSEPADANGDSAL